MEKHAREPRRRGPNCGPTAPDAAHLACTVARVGVLGLALAGCSSSLLSVGAPPGSLPSLPQPPRLAQQQQLPAATQREHQRILAAYGGAYEDARLEAVLNQTVVKLVATSSGRTCTIASPFSIRRR